MVWFQHPHGTGSRPFYGCRLWDQTVEDEATWLAGSLLLPVDAALAIARGGMSPSEAVAHSQVSEKMVRHRLNVTGAKLRVAS